MHYVLRDTLPELSCRKVEGGKKKKKGLSRVFDGDGFGAGSRVGKQGQGEKHFPNFPLSAAISSVTPNKSALGGATVTKEWEEF